MKNTQKMITVKTIDDLGFSGRICNALKAAGISSIKQFMALNWTDLEKIEGIGMGAQVDIIAVQKKIKEGKIIVWGSNDYYDLTKNTEAGREIASSDLKEEKSSSNINDGIRKPGSEYKKTKKIISASRLEDLGLSVNTCKALKNANIDTFEKFETLTWDDLAKIKGLGMESQIAIVATQKKIKEGKIIIEKAREKSNPSVTAEDANKNGNLKYILRFNKTDNKQIESLSDPVSELVSFIDDYNKHLNKKLPAEQDDTLETFKLIIKEGKTTSTYKMALARAIVELCGVDALEDDPVRISLKDVAKRFIRYYWDQIIFFDYAQSGNSEKIPVVVQSVKELIKDYQEKTGNQKPRLYKEVELFLKNELYEELSRTVNNVYYTIPKDVAHRFTNLDGRNADEIIEFDQDSMTFLLKKSIVEEIQNNSSELLNMIYDRWKALLLIFNRSITSEDQICITEEEITRAFDSAKAIEHYGKKVLKTEKDNERPEQPESNNSFSNERLIEKKSGIRNAKEMVSEFYTKNELLRNGYTLDEQNRLIEKNGIKISSSDGLSFLIRFNSSNISNQEQMDEINKCFGVTVYYFEAPYSTKVKWDVSACKKVNASSNNDQAYFVCKSLDEGKTLKLLKLLFPSYDHDDVASVKYTKQGIEEGTVSEEEKEFEEKANSKESITAETVSFPEKQEPQAEIIRYNPLKTVKSGKDYLPAFLVINKKIYKTYNWHDALKILMYYQGYKTDNRELLEGLSDRSDSSDSSVYIRSEKWTDENRFFAKFSPELYIRVVQNNAGNYKMLNKIRKWIGDFELYVIRKDLDSSNELNEELAEKKINELIQNNNYKKGSTKRVIASINSKVFNKKERFFYKIEKEFDRVIMIGDIEINETEEVYLKDFMNKTLEYVLKKGKVVHHPKVFAYGMVRAALKHYTSKRYWPYINEEYGVLIPGNYQTRVNNCFRDILINNDKAYFIDETQYIQNICMHAFVCDKCADQLFDYIFEFWRVDLSRSIENMTDESGNNRFDILIEEIQANEETGINGVMLHTTMALKMNPRGCKTRFRRILKMIDRKYWNNEDFSESKNRLSILFTKWANNKNSLFYKEYQSSFESRKHGRGEKSLSRPSIVFDTANKGFKIFLPRQILRNCKTDEHPLWAISVGGKEKSLIEPELVQGKASLYTNECSVAFSGADMYERIDIVLYSERINYFRWTIKSSECRFFNAKGRNVDYDRNYVSRDACIAFVKKGNQLQYLSGSFTEQEIFGSNSQIYTFDAKDGDIFILPNGHALPVGRRLEEGIVGSGRAEGVKALYKDDPYEITSKVEKVFFKATKSQLNGTSIKILKSDQDFYFGKITSKKIVEFKLDEQVEDIYGYFVDLRDYVKEDGIYKLEIKIPNSKIIHSSVCYIKGFEYRFDDAPYIFEEAGRISFPANLSVETDNKWEINSYEKRLSFKIDEKLENRVRNRKLILSYNTDGNMLKLIFDLPVLYWKFKETDEWSFDKPMDVNMKDVPNKIYVDGFLNLSAAKLYVVNDDDLEESEINISHEENGYYFRMANIIGNLNRDRAVRTLNVSASGEDTEFLNIICKSRVISKNITGDFKANKLYGNYEIIGSSDYAVSILYEGEKIEEDIPVIDGHFEIDGIIKEGTYTIELYEAEEDDSGFDSMYFLLDKEELLLADPNNLERKTIYLRRIRYGGSKFAPIQLANKYWIVGLHKMNYYEDICGKIEFDTWQYESDNTDVLSKFSYYTGIIVYRTEQELKELAEALVLFDDSHNTGDAKIYVLDEEKYVSLVYTPTRKRLLADDSGLSSYEKKKAKVLDDDKYHFEVEIGVNV